MAHDLPPLSSLRAFEAAGRLGSLVEAAKELGVTASAVSHGIRALEDRLGVALFARNARKLVLTPAGADLLGEATPAFEGLSRAMNRLRRGRSRAGLRVSAAPTFAARWLLPRLPQLRRRHPGLSVSITTEHAWVELGDGRFDMAIRMSREPVGPGEWHRLVPVRLVPVGPVSVTGIPVQEALRRLAPIHVTPASEDWAAWAAAQDVPSPDGATGLHFDTIHMATDAAAQGLGIALARLPTCAADLASGRLAILGKPVEGNTSYWLVTRPGALRQAEGRLFAAWLGEELRREPSPAAAPSQVKTVALPGRIQPVRDLRRAPRRRAAPPCSA
ncbi:LysR substrate-binding domain-containing protein [Muricoccus radiodurans]|uniref:LysR substrate-binding domain-containing protein n=1 Tax=Muricoccus radiodurans TaxID=2231721 RepID=UPI003CF1705A